VEGKEREEEWVVGERKKESIRYVPAKIKH